MPVECPAGTFNNKLYGKVVSDCQLCPLGHECDTATVDTGAICRQGYYCPLGSAPAEYPCPPGTFGGFRTGLKDLSECMPCPAGYYCPLGTATPVPSPPGYYQPHSGIGSEQGLIICPPKHPCNESSMVTYKGRHCEPGYYCPAGSTSSKQIPCPAGTYSDSYFIYQALECLPCPMGYKCAVGSTSNDLINCPKNQFCLEGTADSDNLKCPNGTYAPY